MVNKKNKNIWILLIAYLFVYISVSFFDFFLSYFLKEQGFSILKIGALVTLSLSIGGFIVSLIYSKILVKIKIKTGLLLGAFLHFLTPFIVFVFPTQIGALISSFNSKIEWSVSNISSEVATQHNIDRKNPRKFTSYFYLFSSFGYVLGFILAVLLVPLVGFRNSFLAFSLISIIAFFIYLKFDDSTRFKIKKNTKLPKISFNLKILILAELLYWFGMSSSFALVITFLVVDSLGGSMGSLALIFSALYVSIVITSFLTRNNLSKYNFLKTSIGGMIIIILGAIVFILTKNVAGAVVAMVLEGIGASIWGPSKQAMFYMRVPKEQRENMAGYLQGWTTLVKSFGPLVGGLLAVSFSLIAPFMLRIFCSLLAIGIYIYLLKKVK